MCQCDLEKAIIPDIKQPGPWFSADTGHRQTDTKLIRRKKRMGNREVKRRHLLSSAGFDEIVQVKTKDYLLCTLKHIVLYRSNSQMFVPLVASGC